jgi:aspartyl-tRNA(Asn)/glutamyl-tRNA(Gln) amidotransferase subunit A
MATTPRLSGFALRTVARIARSDAAAFALKQILRKDLHVDELARLPDAMRGDFPNDTRAWQARPPRAGSDAKLPLPARPWSPTSDALTEAYRSGKRTPREVVDRVLACARDLERHTPYMGPIFEYDEATARSEADAATARYKAGKPLGPLDGVPFAVKEEMNVRGYPKRTGTAFASREPCAEDATCVRALREVGAIVVGSTPMTEYGMTPNGVNPLRKMPRNPHATDRIAGGSSTGSGVAVATGLVPFAIGADGGGSVRIPSAINGVFGIKPTWGRVSRHTASLGTVAHLGPLASSVLDLARMLEVSGVRDVERDRETVHAPEIAPGSLVRALGRGVKGLVVGVDDGEWADATPAVARAGEEAIRALEREGAKIAKIAIPIAKHAAAIGYVTIGVEARGCLAAEWRDHADDMSHDLQVSLAALSSIGGHEVIDAMRLRTGLRRDVAKAFETVDLLALPTVAATAARVTDGEMESGFLDAGVIEGLCRFAFLGNLTGMPGATAPVGKDPEGLPIGFQLVGDAFDEATVLAATAHLERVGVAKVERPRVSVEV